MLLCLLQCTSYPITFTGDLIHCSIICSVHTESIKNPRIDHKKLNTGVQPSLSIEIMLKKRGKNNEGISHVMRIHMNWGRVPSYANEQPELSYATDRGTRSDGIWHLLEEWETCFKGRWTITQENSESLNCLTWFIPVRHTSNYIQDSHHRPVRLIKTVLFNSSSFTRFDQNGHLQ
jgi:hypothetical protein